jgi:hypothetical protein
MKLVKSEALKLKYQALFFLRIKQRCTYIATECGYNSADVLGCNEKKMIEIEVKTNMPDFKNDFKKNKHSNYSSSEYNWKQQSIPNQFYFAVPPSMVEDVKKYLDEKGYDKYGVLALADPDTDGELRVHRTAKKLHERKPNSHVAYTIALRMGSELLRFHEAWL